MVYGLWFMIYFLPSWETLALPQERQPLPQKSREWKKAPRKDRREAIPRKEWKNTPIRHPAPKTKGLQRRSQRGRCPQKASGRCTLPSHVF